MIVFARAVFGAMRLVPTWVWLLLALAVLYHVGVNWHDAKVKTVYQSGYGQGVTDTNAAMAQLQRDRARADALIAEEIRRAYDDESRRIAAAADALRVRGPGKAACPNPALLPARSGGRSTAGSDTDAARLDLPAAERAAVPWPWLVDRAESHDAMRAEVLAWRDWHRRLTAEWGK